jgi:hypothetical protein
MPASPLESRCYQTFCRAKGLALRVASVSSIKCSPHVAGPRMCAGVHDRPVRRLLAWLLTLSAWEAGEPSSHEVFQSQTWPFERPFGGLSGGVGAAGPEQLIKMATGQLLDAYGMRLQPPRQGRHL